MCGITGIVGSKASKDSLLRMMEAIKHRGPDGNGYFINNNVALGHVRLSITGGDSGKQPIFNENGNLVIIFNGEIYNYLELKDELLDLGHNFKTKTDTEVIIHGYEEWGVDVLMRLRGMFAFAIWDKTKETLFLARDKAGIKPLYYSYQNGELIFASEIKSILASEYVDKILNRKLLASYLSFGFNACSETMFEGIYNLPAGEYMLYDKNKLSIHEYFKLEFEEESRDIQDEIERAIIGSVKLHEECDCGCGAFLSSGVDSSLIASISNVKRTYTVGYYEDEFSEIDHAKNLSNILKKENINRVVSKEDYFKALDDFIYYMDEPLADPSAVTMQYLANEASKYEKVIMSGEGADELFAGYLSYLDDYKNSFYMKVPYLMRALISKVVALLPDFLGSFFLYRKGKRLEDYYIGVGRITRDEIAIKLINDKKQIKTTEITKPIFERYKNKNNLIKKQAVDFYFYLNHDFLLSIDRNCMQYGLEARTPFLDDAIYNVSSSLAIEKKISDNTTKVALRNVAKKYIPNDAYKRKKLGFPVPLKKWLRDDDVYFEIKKTFQSDEAANFFSQKRILKLLNNYKKGKNSNYKLIWAIYIFLLWYKKFFETTKKEDGAS